MPARSASQFRLMQMIAHGGKPREGGPSKEVAKEFVEGQSPQGLPEHVPAAKATPKKKTTRTTRK